METTSYSLPRRLLAEFAGSFAWIFTAGAAASADAFARAAGAGAGPLGTALAQGLVVAAMVAALTRVSGGHLNPAVTIGYWVTRRMGTLESGLYAAAQIAGGVAAAYAVAALLPAEAWRAARLGAPLLAEEMTRASGMLLEAAATFLVVLVFFAVAESGRGWAVGAAVAAAVLALEPFTGGALNPVRALGPAMAAGAWANHGVYWVGPLAGGLAAGWLWTRLFASRSPA